MADVEALEVPVELRLEFGAVVSLHDVDAERQPAHDVVDKLHRRTLIARVVDFQDADPSAIVNGRELIQAAPRAGDSLEKFDVDLQAMAGLRLLVPLPAFPVWLVLLIRRQARHPRPRQDAVH